jgi:hypothetical protein
MQRKWKIHASAYTSDLEKLTQYTRIIIFRFGRICIIKYRLFFFNSHQQKAYNKENCQTAAPCDCELWTEQHHLEKLSLHSVQLKPEQLANFQFLPVSHDLSVILFCLCTLKGQCHEIFCFIRGGGGFKAHTNTCLSQNPSQGTFRAQQFWGFPHLILPSGSFCISSYFLFLAILPPLNPPPPPPQYSPFFPPQYSQYL